MKVLVVGGGGREHALVWKLSQSPLVSQIFCAPGNAGIADLAECLPIQAGDINSLLVFALKEKVDVTVVGPEAPLAYGIVNLFQDFNLKIFGPRLEAVGIESSKAFAKSLMTRHNIPTAAFSTFSNYHDALAYIREIGAPCVVKADGLAAGKGVVVCQTEVEADKAITAILKDRIFGDAGQRVVIEEFLQGEEMSVLAFTDGKTVLPMVAAQDHKRVFDGDQGPNTGGMGAYTPPKLATPELINQVMEQVLQPAAAGMASEGRPFTGVLYAGLMITPQGIKVLEFNARFGDPETQVILPCLKTDLMEIILAVTEGRLDEIDIKWSDQAAACVVLASAGYPDKYDTGKPISGLDQVDPDVLVFHSGTARRDDGQVVTAGGRVLGVTATGADLPEALQKVYREIDKIFFAGMNYRKDIGFRDKK